jgi:hypothetical protein
MMHNAVLVSMADYLGALRASITNKNSSSNSSSSVCNQQSSTVGLPGMPRQPCMPQPDAALLLCRQQQALMGQLAACGEQPRQAARQLMRQQVGR